MESWSDIRRWRKEQRARLAAERAAIPLREREQLAAAIVERLADRLVEQPAKSLRATAPRCVGFYWPMKGEADLRPFIRALLGRGIAAALPVVVEKNAPLEFWRWDTGTKLTRQSVWGIPVPAERAVVKPDVLLIPLIGFDGACHRLGNGGGYYDRTLASLDPKPLAIGVGLDAGELATIYPQGHDVPMDLIVTERRVAQREG